jgi:hypothetical protein
MEPSVTGLKYAYLESSNDGWDRNHPCGYRVNSK